MIAADSYGLAEKAVDEDVDSRTMVARRRAEKFF
jgi:hypothetical protein